MVRRDGSSVRSSDGGSGMVRISARMDSRYMDSDSGDVNGKGNTGRAGTRECVLDMFGLEF